MAAAIIPAVISGVEAVAPMIPNIITGIESLFGAGTGAQKLQAATRVVQSAATAAVAAGKASGTLFPTSDQAAIAVQSVVTQMQAAGQLPPHTAPAPQAPAAAIPGALLAQTLQGVAQAGVVSAGVLAGTQEALLNTLSMLVTEVSTVLQSIAAEEAKAPGVLAAVLRAVQS